MNKTLLAVQQSILINSVSIILINICLKKTNTWELEGAWWSWAGRRVGICTTAGRRRRIWGIRRNWKGAPTTVLWEGLWISCINRHKRLVVAQVAKLHQKAVLGVKLAVSWHQHRRKHWGKNNQPNKNIMITFLYYAVQIELLRTINNHWLLMLVLSIYNNINMNTLH